MFDSLYTSHDRPIRSLGALYKPPARFAHGVETLVAVCLPDGGDGRVAEVYETRMPARFYKVVGRDRLRFDGQIQRGFTVSTGSGNACGELAGHIALAIAEGMLDFEPLP